MCGIVGIIAKTKRGLFNNHIDAFSQMLFVDQLRGTSGTGLFYDEDDKVMFLKQPNNATQFMNNKNYHKATQAALKNGRFIIGHNRAATMGSSIWKNTHPFVEGNIILVHNGTLKEHHSLAKTEVDSNAIAIHMNIHGAEKTLAEINGAFALVWVNMKDNTLNLCRNSERPLALLETNNSWIIASELAMGTWIAGRNNLNVISSIELKEGVLHTFNLDEAISSGYTTKEVALKVHQLPTSWGNHRSHDYYKNSHTPTYPENNVTDNDEKILFEDKELFFAGNKIRFIPEKEIQTHNLGYPFLMADVYHSSVANVPWFSQQVKIMGSREFLETLVNSNLLEGIVTGVIVTGEEDKDEIYYVRGVTSANKEKVPTVEKKKQLKLEVIKTYKKKLRTREMCHLWITNTRHP